MTDTPIATRSDPGELSPATAPTRTPSQTPYQRDVAPAEQGRAAIEAVRAEGLRRRQGGEPAPQPGPRPTAGDAPPTPVQPNMRPAWVPESAWDAKTGFKLAEFGQHYRVSIAPRLQAAAAEKARRATLPQNPDDYKVATTETFRPPEGVERALDSHSWAGRLYCRFYWPCSRKGEGSC